MKKILTGLMAATLLSTSLSFGLAPSALAESARDRAQTVVPKGWQDSYKEWHYAPAVKVDGRIYVSGVAVVPEHGDYAAAYRKAWHKIGDILHASGASLDDVVEIVSYHTNLKAQLGEFGRVKDEFIRAPYPAWTAVGVSQLAMPGEVAEIRVVAHSGGIHDLTG